MIAIVWNRFLERPECQILIFTAYFQATAKNKRASIPSAKELPYLLRAVRY